MGFAGSSEVRRSLLPASVHWWGNDSLCYGGRGFGSVAKSHLAQRGGRREVEEEVEVEVSVE